MTKNLVSDLSLIEENANNLYIMSLAKEMISEAHRYDRPCRYRIVDFYLTLYTPEMEPLLESEELSIVAIEMLETLVEGIECIEEI